MGTIIPVILCGGAGSRLWPASRESFPKQLASFGSDSSLFQQTLARVSGDGFGRPIVVTGEDHRFLVAEQARAAGAACDIILEPARRDSCMAVAVAAEHAAASDPDAVILVLAADHAIPSVEAFVADVWKGYVATCAGRLVTFGIRPAVPATAYGYIKPGAALDGMTGVCAVEAFVEKPDSATAESYVKRGFLWNSGNFLFRARIFLEETARLAPETAAAARSAYAAAARDLDFVRLGKEGFVTAPSISIDYAVMEKTGLAAVVPAEFAWSDVGSWAALWDLAAKDPDGNAVAGHVSLLGVRNAYVHSPDILTAVIGLDDVVVVTTRDAVLVASRARSEDVKALVAKLAAEGRSEATAHLRTYRPWGSYERIDAGARYQVKRIMVKPGGKLSLQSHMHRAEHWIVVRGSARVTIDGAERLIAENESVYVPLGAVHRLENPGKLTLELIEVQSGAYLGEDDIVRYEDAYNRA